MLWLLGALAELLGSVPLPAWWTWGKARLAASGFALLLHWEVQCPFSPQRKHVPSVLARPAALLLASLGLATPLAAAMRERDASGADFARPAALVLVSLGLTTPPPAAIPGWARSKVPQRSRVIGDQANCVDCLHAPANLEKM